MGEASTVPGTLLTSLALSRKMRGGPRARSISTTASPGQATCLTIEAVKIATGIAAGRAALALRQHRKGYSHILRVALGLSLLTCPLRRVQTNPCLACNAFCSSLDSADLLGLLFRGTLRPAVIKNGRSRGDRRPGSWVVVRGEVFLACDRV